MTDLFSAERRKRLVLRRGREGAVRNRHPWIFAGAVHREHGPADAAVADLFTDGGELLASGFYSAQSQIRLRALSFSEPVTEELIVAKIAAAISRRSSIAFAGETSCFRLIHSEGDELSGVIADRYGDVVVLELTSAGADRVKELIARAISDASGCRSLLFKNDLPARRLEGLPTGDAFEGERVAEVEVRENGLRLIVSFSESQKTGFFLDQRENRALVRQLANGRAVLNLFAYTGGFGVNAAAGGAAQVREVDASEPAIRMAERNHALNRTSAEVVFDRADAFAFTRQLVRDGAEFDIVICDPPAFAKSRSEVERAARGYKDINLQSLKLVRRGGLLLTFSCSGHVAPELFQKIVFSAALDANKEVRIIRRLGAGADHPVSIYCPEGEYLKGLMLQVDDPVGGGR